MAWGLLNAMGVDSIPETHQRMLSHPVRHGETHTTLIVAEEVPMYRHIIRNTTMVLGTLLLGSTLVMAGDLQGNCEKADCSQRLSTDELQKGISTGKTPPIQKAPAVSDIRKNKKFGC